MEDILKNGIRTTPAALIPLGDTIFTLLHEFLLVFKNGFTVNPLTYFTGLDPRAFHWAPEHQKAFDNINALRAQDVLLRYPDHNKAFHIIPTPATSN
jgi:hypothetical protein